MDPSPQTPECPLVHCYMAYVHVDVDVFTYKVKASSQPGFCNSAFNPIKEGMSAGERQGGRAGQQAAPGKAVSELYSTEMRKSVSLVIYSNKI